MQCQHSQGVGEPEGWGREGMAKDVGKTDIDNKLGLDGSPVSG